MRQLRQPRLAEIIAAKLREDILTGRLREGDLIPRQEHLLKEFRTSLPAVREAMRILETDGLISVRRGNVGGAVVHLPTPGRAAEITSMVLQSRRTTAADVSDALLRIEPICAGMCAARPDRDTEVVPYLQEAIDMHEAAFDDLAQWNANARRFHELLVERCGNQTLIVVVGSLEAIRSAHESAVWEDVTATDEEPEQNSPLVRKTRRAALRDHAKLLAAITAGQEQKAISLATAHIGAARRSTPASSTPAMITAKLVGAADRGEMPAAL